MVRMVAAATAVAYGSTLQQRSLDLLNGHDVEPWHRAGNPARSAGAERPFAVPGGLGYNAAPWREHAR